MAIVGTADITRLVRAWQSGDDSAVHELMPIVYEELRRTAQHYMRRERPGHPLQSTDLIHETFLRLVGLNHIDLRGRSHFFAIAARIMRRVLVEHARHREYAKRSEDMAALVVEESWLAAPERDLLSLEIDEALGRLAVQAPRKERVVELRFFRGLSVGETAAALGVSVQTVMRDWSFAKAWLLREMGGGRRSASTGAVATPAGPRH